MERAKSIVKASADAPNQEAPEGTAPPSDAPVPPLERSRSIRQPSKIALPVVTEEQESQGDQTSADPDDSSQASTAVSGSADDESKPPSAQPEESGDKKSPRPSIRKSIIVPAESGTTEDGGAASKGKEGGAEAGESPPQAAKKESTVPPPDAPKKPTVFVSAITKEMRASMTQFQLATALVAEEEDFKKKEAEKNAPPKDEKPPTPPPPPEVRALPFIPRPNRKILWKIEREMSVERYYLMGKRVHGDPHAPESCSFFVIGDIGKRNEVKIRQLPSCQCGDYLEMRLCKHLMFVMLKYFKLKQGDHRIWQRALLKSELQSLLSDPRITQPRRAVLKAKFISKLFPPRRSAVKHPSEVHQYQNPGSTQDDRALCPQFCPICLEQFNFIAETPEIPYLGPIPWKPKFMPKLDMGPPASIKKMADEKKRLQDAIKKHQEDLKNQSGEEAASEKPPGDGSKDGKEPGKEAPKVDTEKKDGENPNSEDAQSQSADQKPAEEPEPEGPPLRRYETILYCPNPDCRGNEKCFKIVHEWCYRTLDNYGLYPRGKAAPSYCLM